MKTQKMSLANLQGKLSRNEMKNLTGGNNPCYQYTCCAAPDSPSCVAGPCTGTYGCTSVCVCQQINQ